MATFLVALFTRHFAIGSALHALRSVLRFALLFCASGVCAWQSSATEFD